LALLSALVVVSPWAALQAKQDKAQTAETVASSTTDPAANALLEQGKAALSEKRYTDAFALFSRAQVADSQLAADAEMWQALTQELQGNLEASEGYYKQALALALPNSNSQITIMDLYTRLLISLNKAGEAKLVSAQEAAVRDELAQQIKSAIHHDLDVYKIGGNVRAPILIEKIEPEYTFDARLAKYTGSAVLSLEIDDNGIPRNIRIIRGLGLGLDERAVEAVRHWKFEPARLNGSSVAVVAQVEVNFKLL
jgi:TonB family protein